jgi:predicted nucleotidyltransferase
MDVIAVLNREKVDYAVIGAMAGSVHGSIRASVDADAVISLAVQKSAELEKKFQTAGFKTELRRGDLDDPIPAVLSLKDNHENRVDLLVGLRGMESKVFSRTLEVSFSNEKLRVVGREDFIAMKVFAGGPVDLMDAARVISAEGESLDIELLRRLARGFGNEAAESLDRLLTR